MPVTGRGCWNWTASERRGERSLDQGEQQQDSSAVSSGAAMSPRFLVSVFALLVAAPTPARADVTLPPIFSDAMVLQANLAVPIFGLAEPGEEVSVAFRGQM